MPSRNRKGLTRKYRNRCTESFGGNSMNQMTDTIAFKEPGGIRRTYIRHPTDIPIEVAASRRKQRNQTSLRNLSLGGLAFISDHEHHKGDLVNLRIPAIDPDFEAVCEVMWCHDEGATYEVGARFTSEDDLYQLRMVEQVCHIEQYRRRVEADTGRSISANE
ncbi:MAG: PilZ domain-containing protein, partial [Gammaproteobacteria bacterium]